MLPKTIRRILYNKWIHKVTNYIAKQVICIVFLHLEDFLCTLGEVYGIVSLSDSSIITADSSTLPTASTSTNIITWVSSSITNLLHVNHSNLNKLKINLQMENLRTLKSLCC